MRIICGFLIAKERGLVLAKLRNATPALTRKMK